MAGGRIYGATVTNAFALDARSGKLLWSRKLIRNKKEGVDIVPQLYDDTVLISTVPGSGVSNFYRGGALGVVWALAAATGKPRWKFNTVKGGAKLWGNPKVNSGGGLWYPPAVDNQGRVFLSVSRNIVDPADVLNTYSRGVSAAAARIAIRVVCRPFADGPGRDRTCDLGIKSPLLYQLSYRPRGEGTLPPWSGSTSRWRSNGTRRRSSTT
jgi:hypothetical protein